MKRIILVVVSMLLLQGCASAAEPKVTVDTGEEKHEFLVEVMDDDEERALGLMHRDFLEGGRGMWFVFEEARDLSFWMMNVKFPIDIIFIDRNFKVLNFAESVPPCEKKPCASYVSKGKAKYVLEVNAGVAKGMELEVGDVVAVSRVVE